MLLAWVPSAESALLCRTAAQVVKSTDKAPKAALVGRTATQAVRSTDKTLRVVPVGDKPMEIIIRPKGRRHKWNGSGSKHAMGTKANTEDNKILR